MLYGGCLTSLNRCVARIAGNQLLELLGASNPSLYLIVVEQPRHPSGRLLYHFEVTSDDGLHGAIADHEVLGQASQFDALVSLKGSLDLGNQLWTPDKFVIELP